MVIKISTMKVSCPIWGLRFRNVCPRDKLEVLATTPAEYVDEQKQGVEQVAENRKKGILRMWKLSSISKRIANSGEKSRLWCRNSIASSVRWIPFITEGSRKAENGT